MKNLLLTTAALSAFLTSPSMAMDEASVMAQLQAMQKQIDALQGQVKTLNKELSKAKSQAASAEKTATEAKAIAPVAVAREPSGSDVKVSLKPGPRFETIDGEYSFKISGFAQIDAGKFQDDIANYPDGTTLRRARLSASGVIARDFSYKIENDFANNASALTDVYLEYTGFKPISIMAGQFKEPFGLETLTSDLFTSFVERASPYAFSPDRNIGLAVSSYGISILGAWTATAGGFGSGTGVASTANEAHDYTARLTLAPLAEKDKVLHFGIAGSHRVPDSASHSMRFASRPETQLSNTRMVVDTTVTNVDNVNLLGLETAGVWGPASLQGEYVHTDVNRNLGLTSPTFEGYYIEASYFLTGESRNYLPNQAKFDRITPLNPFSLSKGGWGAWQIMARFSDLDLNDGSVRAGEMKNMSLGVKWYPQANVAIMLDYMKINSDRSSVVSNDDPSVFVLRTQFDF